MAATAYERFGSRRKTGTNAYEFLYYVNGYTDEEDAQDAVITAAPSTYLGLLSQGITDFEVIGDDLCFATVTYGIVDWGFEPDQTQFFEFSTQGGTQHITQSLETIASYGPDDDGADHGGSIGVDSEGKNAAGVDITAPVFTFTVRRKFNIGDIDSAYIASLYALTAKTNIASFTVTVVSGVSITFEAGEALFLGASGGQISQSQVEISYAFAGSPNISGSGEAIEIGDITVDAKNGWEYLWVQYTQDEDLTASAMVLKPKYAYVERVYNPGDFDDLEIA